MTQRSALLVDGTGVIGRVHQLTEELDPFMGHGEEWNGGLGVMHVGPGEDRTGGDLAVGDIEVQLVAAPAHLIALAAGLDAETATGVQFGQHLGEKHMPLALDAGAALAGLGTTDLGLADFLLPGLAGLADWAGGAAGKRSRA